MLAQERDERHEDARRAEAALQPVSLAERGLKRMQRVARAVSEALHGLALVAVRLDGEHEAGAGRLAGPRGREGYGDDPPLKAFLGGMPGRGPAPRGGVTAPRFGKDVDWSQFVVVDHRDIPGPNVVALIEQDQPVLAADYVRHVHEPVLLLAHPSRDAVRRAVRAVDVVIAPESPALDFRTAPAPDQIQYGPDNVLKHLQIVKGDVERALAQAPVVVSGTRSEEHTSELQSRLHLVCRLLLEKKKKPHDTDS